MPLHIGFETARFTGANPNAPSGEEFARWLGDNLQSHGVTFEKIRSTGPKWQWDAAHSGGNYSVTAEASGSTWKLTIEKRRKLSDQLFGKGQLAPTDPFVWLIENALQGEPDIKNVRRG